LETGCLGVSCPYNSAQPAGICPRRCRLCESVAISRRRGLLRGGEPRSSSKPARRRPVYVVFSPTVRHRGKCRYRRIARTRVGRIGGSCGGAAKPARRVRRMLERNTEDRNGYRCCVQEISDRKIAARFPDVARDRPGRCRKLRRLESPSSSMRRRSSRVRAASP